jgi:site-specific DNA-methyltransferase (adenine-specific)
MNSAHSFLNQIIQGDCLKVLPLLPDESVDLIITDPPYLVDYKPRSGHRCTNDHNGDWLEPAFLEMFRVLKPDSLCVSFYGWPWIDQFLSAWKRIGFRPVSHLIWLKPYCSRTGYTRSHHEVGYLLAKGRPPKPEHPLKDVLPWQYTKNILHPTQKPVIGLIPLIRAFSRTGQIVLDPFAGSGSTGLAAKTCQRRFILIEIDPEHCTTAQTRLTQNSLAAKQATVIAPSKRHLTLEQPRQLGGWQKEINHVRQ